MHQVLQRHLDNTHYERMLQQRLADALSWALPWQCGMQSCLINRLVRASNISTTIGQRQARWSWNPDLCRETDTGWQRSRAHLTQYEEEVRQSSGVQTAVIWATCTRCHTSVLSLTSICSTCDPQVRCVTTVSLLS